jgi:hypothetical protein
MTVQLIVLLFFALLPGTATLAAFSSRRRLQSEAPGRARGGSDRPTTLSGSWDPCGQPDRRSIVSHFAVCGFCLSRLLLWAWARQRGRGPGLIGWGTELDGTRPGTGELKGPSPSLWRLRTVAVPACLFMLPLWAIGIGRVIYPGRERNELASGPVVDGASESASE